MKILYKISCLLFIATTISSCAISKLEFYPPVTGTVLLNDKPVENAELTFIVSYFRNELIKQMVRTNKDGRFYLPESSKTLLYGPHYHFSSQLLLIKYNNLTYIGIDGGRNYGKEYIYGLILNVNCDISNKQDTHIMKALNGSLYEPIGNGEYKENYYEYNGICITSQ